MSISIENELIKWLSSLDDISIIDKILAFRKTTEGDWWNDLSEEEQRDIQIGLEQANNNEFISNETVMKSFEKWH